MNVRAKGNRYELSIAKKFQANTTWLFYRVPNSGGLNIKGDIYCRNIYFPFTIECKDQKFYNISSWCVQLGEEMKYEGTHGVLIFHRPYTDVDYSILVPKPFDKSFNIPGIEKRGKLTKLFIESIQSEIYVTDYGYLMMLDILFPILKEYTLREGGGGVWRSQSKLI